MLNWILPERGHLTTWTCTNRQNKQTDKQTNTRSSLESGGRSSPAAESLVFAKRERKIYGRKKLSILLRVASFSESIDCWSFLHSRVRPRVRHESNRNRSGFADEARNLPNERTNERTNIVQREEGWNRLARSRKAFVKLWEWTQFR